MSKVNSVAILTREALADAPDGQWFDTVLDTYNGFNDQVRKVLQNGISIGDNTPWKFVALNMTHATEYEIKNPFDDPEMTVKNCLVAQCMGATLDSLGRPTGALYTLATPQLQWRQSGKPSNSIIASAYYAPVYGNISLRKSTSQSIANLTTVALAWDLDVYKNGSDIQHLASSNDSKITFLRAGIVQANWNVTWAANNTGWRQTFLTKNGVASGTYSRWGTSRVQAVTDATQTTQTVGSCEISVAANDYLELQVGQASGGALDAAGGANNECAMQLSYCAPDVATVGKITLFFTGA